MKLLVRAIVTGFGLAVGSAVFRKHVAPRLGLDDDDKKAKAKAKAEPDVNAADGATDPHLREQFS